jgi:hypothetical protein
LVKDEQFPKAPGAIVLRVVTVEIPNTISFNFKHCQKARSPIEPS